MLLTYPQRNFLINHIDLILPSNKLLQISCPPCSIKIEMVKLLICIILKSKQISRIPINLIHIKGVKVAFEAEYTDISLVSRPHKVAGIVQIVKPQSSDIKKKISVNLADNLLQRVINTHHVFQRIRQEIRISGKFTSLQICVSIHFINDLPQTIIASAELLPNFAYQPFCISSLHLENLLVVFLNSLPRSSHLPAHSLLTN